MLLSCLYETSPIFFNVGTYWLLEPSHCVPLVWICCILTFIQSSRLFDFFLNFCLNPFFLSIVSCSVSMRLQVFYCCWYPDLICVGLIGCTVLFQFSCIFWNLLCVQECDQFWESSMNAEEVYSFLIAFFQFVDFILLWYARVWFTLPYFIL